MGIIEQGNILLHCGNTTFVYHNDLGKYMNIEGATSEDVFDYLFDVRAENSYEKSKRNIFIDYLKDGIQSVLNLMKI